MGYQAHGNARNGETAVSRRGNGTAAAEAEELCHQTSVGSTRCRFNSTCPDTEQLRTTTPPFLLPKQRHRRPLSTVTVTPPAQAEDKAEKEENMENKKEKKRRTSRRPARSQDHCLPSSRRQRANARFRGAASPPGRGAHDHVGGVPVLPGEARDAPPRRADALRAMGRAGVGDVHGERPGAVDRQRLPAHAPGRVDVAVSSILTWLVTPLSFFCFWVSFSVRADGDKSANADFHFHRHNMCAALEHSYSHNCNRSLHLRLL